MSGPPGSFSPHRPSPVLSSSLRAPGWYILGRALEAAGSSLTPPSGLIHPASEGPTSLLAQRSIGKGGDILPDSTCRGVGGTWCTGTEGGPSCSHPHPRPQMMQVIEEYMEDYNQINTTKLRLVLFMDAMSHVCRISRTLRQALGNALLLGVGGSGRSSLTRLASHM